MQISEDPLLAQLLTARSLRPRHRRRKPRRLRPVRFPRSVQLRYVRELRGLVGSIESRVASDLRDALPGLLRQAEIERGDGHVIRSDEASDTVRAIMDGLRSMLSSLVPDAALARLARLIFDDVNRRHVREFDEKYGGIVGIQVVGAPWENGAVSTFVAENTRLIKSLQSDALGQVEGIVHGAIRDGLRVEEVMKQLRERFDVARSRAELIAVDQVGKAQSQIVKLRHKQAGITKGRWSTSKDESVRPSHAAAEGKVYEIDKGLVVDGVSTRPGMPVRCRCAEIPVIEGLEEEGQATQAASPVQERRRPVKRRRSRPTPVKSRPKARPAPAETPAQRRMRQEREIKASTPKQFVRDLTGAVETAEVGTGGALSTGGAMRDSVRRHIRGVTPDATFWDVAKGGRHAGSVRVAKKTAGYANLEFDSSRVNLGQEGFDGLKEFARKSRSGGLTEDDWSPVHSLVHEQYHATSPLHRLSKQQTLKVAARHGRGIEEVLTETRARKATRSLIKATTGKNPSGTGKFGALRGNGAYQKQIDAVKDSISRAVSKPGGGRVSSLAPTRALESASERMLKLGPPRDADHYLDQLTETLGQSLSEEQGIDFSPSTFRAALLEEHGPTIRMDSMTLDDYLTAGNVDVESALNLLPSLSARDAHVLLYLVPGLQEALENSDVSVNYDPEVI